MCSGCVHFQPYPRCIAGQCNDLANRIRNKLPITVLPLVILLQPQPHKASWTPSKDAVLGRCVRFNMEVVETKKHLGLYSILTKELNPIATIPLEHTVTRKKKKEHVLLLYISSLHVQVMFTLFSVPTCSHPNKSKCSAAVRSACLQSGCMH